MKKYFGKLFQSKPVRDTITPVSWTNQGPDGKDNLFNKKTISKVLLGLTLVGYVTYDQTYGGKSSIKCANQAKRQLYTWGWGQYGQLGTGSESNAYVPNKVEELLTQDIKTVAARSVVSAALTEDGKLFTWGRAKGGVLGHDEFIASNITLPTQLISLAGYKLSQVACGYQHMAAITDKGELFTWGNSDHGKLGHNIPATEAPKEKTSRRLSPRSPNDTLSILPQRVGGDLAQSAVKQVSCGNVHTICIDENNQIYVWGSHSNGVLGLGGREDVLLPKKLEYFSDKGVVKVGAGYNYSLALTKNGELYSWGNNDFGQLGNPSRKSYDQPTKISVLDGVKIVDFACGENFVAALSSNSEVYTWGSGIDGQLGHGDKSDLKTPKLLEFDKKIKSIACGNGHTAFITEDDHLYMFGRGREGQLGRADTLESSVTYRTKPQLVEGLKSKKVVQIQCGGDHNLAVVE